MPGICYDFIWIPGLPNGFIWHRGIFKYSLGRIWVASVVIDILCGFHYSRICLDMFGMEELESIWICLDTFGHIWICLRCLDTFQYIGNILICLRGLDIQEHAIGYI